MKKLKCAVLMVLAFCAAGVFAQVEKRDVPYTKVLFKLIEGYFNHEIESRQQAEKLYADAIESCPESYDEYMKETHLARCDYYFGMYIMETYDLTQLEHALDDTSKEFVDPVEQNRRIKAEAAKYYDSSIEHAKIAMDLRGENSPDAMTIYTQALSANCTAKTVGYVLSNGLKIAQYAKKALKVDPKNATACFSSAAQNVYAPGIFGNAVKGRKKMLEFIADETLVKEKFDHFNFTCAVAYSYYRQNKFDEARVWYKKCQDIYPENYAIKDLIAKCDAKLNK